MRCGSPKPALASSYFDCCSSTVEMQLLLSYCFSLRNAPPSCRILSKVLRPCKPRQFALTPFGSHGIIFVFAALMKLYSFFLSLVLTSTLALTEQAQAQTPAKPSEEA